MPSPWRAAPTSKTITKDLHVGWDADTDPSDLQQWHVVMTAAHGEEHWHLQLSREEAKALNKWLVKFLIKTRKEVDD